MARMRGELEGKTMEELQKMAKDSGVAGSDEMDRDELIDMLVEEDGKEEEMM